MSLWGGTLWQMCKKWADTNRAHRGEDDLVRGSAEPPVGHGAIKAEVARRAMETLSQHVAVIENK